MTSSGMLASDNKSPNVLIIFSWHKDMPWQKEVEQGFQDYFRLDGVHPNLYFEYMDGGRFRSRHQLAIFRDYLARKYAHLHLDHVIFESDIAASLLESSPGLFKGSHMMVLNPGVAPQRFNGSSTVVKVHMDFEKSIRDILAFTGARTVYLVGGDTPGTLDRVQTISAILSRIAADRKVVPLTGLPMDSLLKRVSRLDTGGIIFYLLLFRDGDGRQFIPYEVAGELSKQANVPVYSFWTSLMGSGVVGGYMLSGQLVGREAASLLMNGKPGSKQETGDLNDRFHGYFFDWRQLKRWNIGVASLPRGSTVMFRQPRFYEVYSMELGVGIAVLVLVILSIRYRELKKYNREIDTARENLELANRELNLVKQSLEEKNELLLALSVTDSLTGLYNRGYLDEKIRAECARAERYREELSIILVDIDYFKQINDKYGHQVGDGVLTGIADTLRHNVRSTDITGRWGGDELMIICPNSSEQQSEVLAEKLRGIIEQAKHGKAGKVTCSFGVASYVPGTDEERLINDADKALYVSKETGRNCITVATAMAESGEIH